MKESCACALIFDSIVSICPAERLDTLITDWDASEEDLKKFDEPGVPDSYFQIAHAANIGDVFKTIANAEASVMFNCSAGKDRSGVISALILWLCGVRKSDIVYDYMRTKEKEG